MLITTLRQAILAADKRIVEIEKWNSPNFVFDGVDRVTLRLHPRGGVQVIFHRGSKARSDVADFHFDDPTGLLTWPAPDRGVLTVDTPEEAQALSGEITQLVRRWIAVPVSNNGS
jgi:hypothetical protein